MQNTIRLFLKEFWRNRAKRRRMRSAVLAMSFLVAFGVLWQLRITGITMTGEALCGYSEHVHGAECEGAVLTCGLEETPGHIHDAACTPAPVLTCELTEHTHDGESCTMAVGEDGAEVCTLTEHTHDTACYTQPEPCALGESEGHTHSSACYTCEAPAHTHTVLCYSNREADLESSAVWEATLPANSGSYAADVAAVALSQVGYTESQQNYDVAEDGVTQRGYTRYGEWYGNPYGDWSAMFASFCLHYGNHPAYEVLVNSGVEAMRLQAEAQQCYAAAGVHTPSVGDLLFLDRDGNGNAEAVAIVTEVSDHEIKAAEGDYENAVAVNTLARTDAAIKGWAVLSTPDLATLEEPEVASDNITITFRIDNADYTNDPGTGNTHLTSPAPIEGGELTYTEWTSSAYKVTGTGTVCTYTIPAGTSIYDNGLDVPNLSVTNIADGNTYSYISSRSWVTAEGSLYSRDTVINEDTTLYLSLYQNGENYDVDFVCCETHNGNMESGLGKSATFRFGQSLSADYIPDAALIQANYTSSNHDVAAFAGWQVKETATGNMVTFTAGTPILEAYADTANYGNAVKVYALWSAEPTEPEETEPVATEPQTTEPEAVKFTAAFVANDVTVGTLELAEDEAIGSRLPVLTAEQIPEGKQFDGWRASGSTVFADETTVLTADTTFYAVFSDPTQATVSYYVDGNFYGDAKVTIGEALGDGLHADPVYNVPGKVFAGWLKEGTQSEYATAETIITGDTRYDAVFAEGYTVTIHDIGPDGSEVSSANSFIVPLGGSVSSYLAQYTLSDGTAATDCTWYSDLNKTAEYEVSAAVTGNLDLYTFTYRLTLTLNPNQGIALMSLVDVTTDAESGEITMTITAREGETLQASDFVVDGVDYSLYTWTANGETIDIQEIIRSGVTETITATSNGELVSGLEECEGHTVNFYVFVNGERKLVASKVVTSYKETSSSRRYLSAATLEAVYGDYGFTASQLTSGTRYFPHVDNDGDNVWADTAVLEAGGAYFSPVNQSTGTVSVYYFPNQTLGATNAPWANYQTAETFYSITVMDPNNQLHTAAELQALTQYVLTGNSCSITVKQPSADMTAAGYEWKIEGATPDTSVVNEAEGTVTYTFTNVTAPITIRLYKEGQVTIIYDLNIQYQAVDEDNGNPTVGGKEYYTMVVDLTEEDAQTTHTILSPSKTTYDTDQSGKYLTIVTFEGWDLYIDNVLIASYTDVGQINAGTQTIDLTKYQDQTLELRGRWSAQATGTSNVYGSTVNFFVNLTGLPMGTLSFDAGTATENFTDSVYASDCGVTATEAQNAGLFKGYESGSYLILGGSNNTLFEGITLEQNHTNLVNNLTAGYYAEADTNQQYKFQLTFPSDEEVLKIVRQMVENGTVIEINGVAIKPEELHTKNFKVFWHVFKWRSDDGWHVDGVLMAQPAKVRIQKTFAGDLELWENNLTRNDYYISIDPTANNETPESEMVHSGGNLWLTGDANPPISIDEDTNTYTWEIELDQYFEYQITEYGHEVTDGEQGTLTTVYKVEGSEKAAENTNGWQTFDDTNGFTITGRSVNADNPDDILTASLMNIYTAPGTVTIMKTDAATGNPMPGIEFTVEKDGDESFTLYELGDSTYTANSDGQTGEGTNTIVTNNVGLAFLTLQGGTYRFRESISGTYDDLGDITVVMQGTANTEYKIAQITSAAAANKEGAVSVVGEDQLQLMIKNYSKSVKLRVVKDWTDGTNAPVEMNVLINNVPYAALGTLSFSESLGWVKEFANVPLYADQNFANYSAMETRILNDYYSSEYAPDGFRYYTVTTDAVFLDANGQELTGGRRSQTDTIVLTVHNARATGELEFLKVSDDNTTTLAGATFELYTYDGTVPYGKPTDDKLIVYKTVTTGADGKISFGNVPGGIYYMKETVTPAGYDVNNKVYIIQHNEAETILQYWDDSFETTGTADDVNGWKPVSGSPKIVNTRSVVDVSINKEVDGNAADTTQKFTFRVVSDKPFSVDGTAIAEENGVYTHVFELAATDGAYILEDIEVGATLNVTEDALHGYEFLRSEASGGVTQNSTNSFTVNSSDGTIHFTNVLYNHDLTIRKLADSLDSETTLAGAVFEVYEKQADGGLGIKIERTIDGTPTTRFTTGEDGLITIPDLTPGEYILREYQAPDGYYRLTQDISFEVAEDGIQCVDDPNEMWIYHAPTTFGYFLSVVNVTGSELPQTGGMGAELYMMAGLLMMAASLMYGFLLRRRRERGAD